jgi:rifampicin phosphotransferase
MVASVGSPDPDPISAGTRPVVALDEPAADEPGLTGGKATALARATSAQLPVVDGFVITTELVAEVDAHPDRDLEDILGPATRATWARLSQEGEQPLAVRSSATTEDQPDSSKAGRFASVIGVTGWPAFVDAVRAVIDSRRAAAEGDRTLAPDHPMGVLVQRAVDAGVGGVAFGVDPVTGRSDRVVVVAAAGGAQRVVSGAVAGTRYQLDHDGDVHEVREGPGGARLSRSQRHDVVTLTERVAREFGRPQDIEWAVDAHGQLWLLQSRPVTTRVVGTPTGPVFSAGPVAETFPAPLSLLEQDLWIRPLRRALREVLEITGTASRRKLDASPLVVCPDGRPAVDIEAFGMKGGRPSAGAAVGLRLRRLRVAWRVGRLRAALPGLARDLVERTDDDLLAVGALTALTDRQLVDLLHRATQSLVALHGHEMLIGLLVRPGTPALTGMAAGLRVLTDARARGLDDREILEQHPVVLALVAPRIQPVPPLPADVHLPLSSAPARPVDESAVLREALRLRVRWIQELSGRAAWLVAERLAGRGVLEHPERVRHLRLPSLEALAADRAALWHVDDDRSSDEPLPARFQLTDAGDVVAVDLHADGAGTGAGGGTVEGTVTHDRHALPNDAVLVVDVLSPELAPLIPQLRALVAETGSVLAHMAILAREAGLTVVVAAAGARGRFPPGTRVRVDGLTGEISPSTPRRSRP